MPRDAWALLVVSIGLGLGIELAFIRARLRERRRDGPGDRSPVGHRPGSDEATGGSDEPAASP